MSSSQSPQRAGRGATLDADSDEVWAARLAADAGLSDQRLNARFAQLLATFAGQPTCSIPHACADRGQAKATYRFFDNQQVTPERLIRPLASASARTCAGQAVVYVVQDSTSLNYSRLTRTTGLGPISDAAWLRGLHVHSTLALDERGVVAGLLGLKIWARPPAEQSAGQTKRQRARQRARRPIADKESCKWLDGIAAARAAFATLPAGQRPRLIHIMDAEGDIHEVLDTIVAHGEGAIIRSAYNRNIAGAPRHAYDAVRQAPLLGRHTVTLAARNGKPARKADVEVRALAVTLTSEQSHPERRPVSLTLLEAYEPQPPANSEPVCWHVWVVDPLRTLADAVAVLTHYGFRWVVEDYHCTLKSGCRVEHLELETAQRLSNALVLYAAVAARLVGLRDLARRDPDGPCTQVLSTDEWRVLVLRCGGADAPLQPPSLRQAILWIGRLGGHQSCRRARMPGIKTLWRGWRDLQQLLAGYRLRC